MIKSSLTWAILVAMLFTGALPAGAGAQNRPQTGAQEAAEAVARDLFLALYETRWDDATALIHPDILTSFRESTLGSMRMDGEQEVPDSLRAEHPTDPDMPEAVAEWLKAKAREAELQYESHLEQLYGVPSLEALEALSPRDLFARSLAANDPSTIMPLLTPEEDWPLLDESVAASFRPSRRVLGSIMEGDSVAYVVYRVGLEVQPRDDRRLAVLPIALTEAGWRARPDLTHSEMFSFGPIGGPISIRAVDGEENPWPPDDG